MNILPANMRFGAGHVLFSLLALLALSLPVVSLTLLNSLEMPYVDPVSDDAAGAMRGTAAGEGASAVAATVSDRS